MFCGTLRYKMSEITGYNRVDRPCFKDVEGRVKIYGVPGLGPSTRGEDRFSKKGVQEIFYYKMSKSKIFIEKKSNFGRSKSNQFWVKWLECVYWRMIHAISTFSFLPKSAKISKFFLPPKNFERAFRTPQNLWNFFWPKYCMFCKHLAAFLYVPIPWDNLMTENDEAKIIVWSWWNIFISISDFLKRATRGQSTHGLLYLDRCRYRGPVKIYRVIRPGFGKICLKKFFAPLF